MFEISFSCLTQTHVQFLLTASDEVRKYLIQNLRSISCKLLEQKVIRFEPTTQVLKMVISM